jgi:hypothetical protein
MFNRVDRGADAGVSEDPIPVTGEYVILGVR